VTNRERGTKIVMLNTKYLFTKRENKTERVVKQYFFFTRKINKYITLNLNLWTSSTLHTIGSGTLIWIKNVSL
jgi:hypothetical protein